MANLLNKETQIIPHTQDAIDAYPHLETDISALTTYLLEHNPLSSKIFIISGPDQVIKLLDDEITELEAELDEPYKNIQEISQEGGDVWFFSLVPHVLFNGRFSEPKKRLVKEAHMHVQGIFDQMDLPSQGHLQNILAGKNMLNYPSQVVGNIEKETDGQATQRYDQSLKILKNIRSVMPDRKLTKEVSEAIMVDRDRKIIGINSSKLNGSSELLLKASKEGLLPVPLVTVENGHRSDK